VERKLFGIALKWLLLGLAVVLIGGWAVARILGGNAQEVRQAEAGRASAEAMQEAGAAAVATVLEQSEGEAELQDLVAKASKEIDDAPDPAAARRATLNAACQLQLYRDDPACAVRRADTP
jgi:hypothetical protein